MLEPSMIECVWSGRAVLGEGPLWCPQRGDAGQLVFVDILGSRLHAHDLASGDTLGWALDEAFCWLVPRCDGIASLRSRLVYLRLDDGCRVVNGPAISPDGCTLYRSDTPHGVIHAFDLSESGELSGKREHVRFGVTQGFPDGMTCDAQGGLWVAHWDGGRLSRFRPDGGLDETLPLPASRVTSCAFGGPGLEQLFITTAALERDDEAMAGGLFRVVPGVKGIPPSSSPDIDPSPAE